MTTRKVISIPKIPQNLPVEIRKPLDQLRQAIIDLQAQTTQPIDGSDLIFGTVSQRQLTPELLIDVNAVRYYIEPLNGTSIKNSSGTLTIRAVRVDGTGTNFLTAGPIKLFKPDGTIAGNGYRWTATAADITDSITIVLKDQNTLTEWDTITLIDITDGGDAVIGAVDATNGLVWTRAIDAGAWTPGTTTTDLIATFYQLGVSIASRTVRVTRSASGTLTAALEANNGEPTTHVITGSGTETLSVLFAHTASGATVIEAVLTVQGGDSGPTGASGLNVATAFIYQRTATDNAPTLPSVTANYDFATGEITGLNNGWTDTIPAAGTDDFLWISLATASSTANNDDILSAEWQAAVKLAETGDVGPVGAAGINTATLTAYKRSASAPTDDPGTLTYTFATADWTPANGWTEALPAGSDPLYALSATAAGTGATDQVDASDWSSPTLILQDGEDAQLARSVTIFRLNSNSINSTAGTFADPLNGNTSWSFSVPALAADGDTVYVATRTFTDDAAAPQDANWSTPAVYALRTDGIDAVDTRFPTIYRLNNNSINSSSGTFADPLDGNPSWSFSVPALAADGDIVYVSSRTLTSDGNAPQDANWATPTIYSQRIDGDTGDTGQRARTVLIFRLNSSAINSTSGTFADPLAGNTSWSFSVPALAADGDIVYSATRTFTDDAAAPQDANWATPTIYAQRTDGSDGATGQRARTVTIFRLNSNTISSTSGTFADPLAGNASWSFSVPALGADGDVVYVAVRTFTDDAAAPQDANWSTPTIYSQRTDGTDGAAGLNVATVFIYQRTATDSAPTLPSVTANYTFATGNVTGLNNGWTDTIPAAGSNDFLWVSIATASSTAADDDILSAEWQAAEILSETGAPGDDGFNTATLTAYKRASTAPTDDPGASLIYTFATADWTPGNGWTKEIPAGSNPVYALSATAFSQSATDTILSADWSSPVLILQDGADGADGIPGIPGASTILPYDNLQATNANLPGTYQFLTGISESTGINVWATITSPGGIDYFVVSNDDLFAVNHSAFLSQIVVGDVLVWFDDEDNPGRWVEFRITSIETPVVNQFKWGVTLVEFNEDASTANISFTDGRDVEIRFSRVSSAVLHYLTNEAHVVSANPDGLGYSLVGSGGTHEVFAGAVSETTNSVHSVQGGATKNGLTMSVVSGTGVYSLSGSNWTTDQEIFTLRAVFDGINYEKTYTIAKARQGSDGGCNTDTLTTISLLDLGTNDPAIVGFRMNSPGDMSEKANAPSGYVTKETWRGACANTAYECRYNHSGSALTGGSAAVNTWHLCNVTRTFELNTGGNPKTATGTFVIRRESDQVVLDTVSVLMTVETNL